jgi:RimJ/RimL family protein N-acetyltransferase
MKGLLVDADDIVANWAFATYKMPPMLVDRALGILDNGKICGAILFQNWNRINVDMSYYGENTLSPGIVRTLCRFGLSVLNVSRCTVITSKRNRRLMRSLQRIGFRLEGTQRCFYGANDCNRNTAVRFVMFRDRIEQLAALKEPPNVDGAASH